MFASAKNLFKPCIFISTRRPSTLCSLFLLIICYVLLLVNPYNRIYIYNGIRLRSKAQYYENTGCLGGEPQTSSQHISSSWKSILTPESLQSYPAYYVNFTIHKNHRLIVPQSALHHTSPLPLLDAGMCIQTNHILNSQPSYRCLPSFFIIGAMKSGTGELLKWLSLHPLLRSAHAPHKREGGFFSRVSHHPSLEAYLSHLPPFSAAQASSLYTFEKSPAYLRNATALRALSTVFPHSRIIVILRKPAERSLSEFLHHSRHRRYRYLPDKGKNTGEVIVNTRYLRNRIIGASNTSTSNNNNSNSIHNSSIHKGVDTWLALSHPPSVSEVVRYFRQGGEREEVGNSRYPRQLRALWDR
ncbi:hypothetical protein EON65_25965 [archaeon]|nr:MAG: hypothetical protein EON65_25965 [archaeon]